MKMLTIEMSDGSKWGVPVEVIARHRAAYYADADEFGGDVERSLAEDTIPLFESSDYEVKHWAQNHMEWSDVESQAKKLQDATPDFQEAWVYGEKAVIEVAAIEVPEQAQLANDPARMEGSTP